MKLIYFLIPLNIFCAFSNELQFGSTIKLFITTLLILLSVFVATTAEKKPNKSILILLALVAFIPSLLSFYFFKSINFLSYSNTLFLIFVFLTFKAEFLKILLYSFSISSFILMPLAFFLKDGNTFGDPAGNANSLGQLVSVGMITNLFLIYQKELSKWLIGVLWLGVFTSGYLLFAINSRGSLLFLIIAVLSMMALNFYKTNNYKVTRKHCVVSISILILLMMGLFLILDNLDLSNFRNMAYRKNLWHAGIKVFSEHWLVGIGNGKLSKVLPNYWDINTNLLSGAGETEYHLHNEFLNKAVEEGFISLAFFIFLILFCIFSAVKYFLSSNNKNANLILPIIGVFIGVCFQISFDRILQFPASGLLFALLCGVLLSLNNPNDQKPFKLFNPFILLLAVLHACFSWPFLYHQILFTNAIGEKKEVVDRIEILKAELSKNTNIEDYKKTVLEKLEPFSESSLKRYAQKNIHLIKEVNKSTLISYLAILIDLEFHWTEYYEKILKSADYPDLKVMTYKKYLQLLYLEGRNEELHSYADQMNQEFPLIMVSAYIIYDYYIELKDFGKALASLKKSEKISNDPLIKKKILLHQLKYDKTFNRKNIEDCILIRKNIEYDSKFVKKNLVSRFDSLDSYYIDFITEMLLLKENDIGYDILKECVKDENLKKKQGIKEFLNKIKVDYPVLHQKLLDESLIK